MYQMINSSGEEAPNFIVEYPSPSAAEDEDCPANADSLRDIDESSEMDGLRNSAPSLKTEQQRGHGARNAAIDCVGDGDDDDSDASSERSDYIRDLLDGVEYTRCGKGDDDDESDDDEAEEEEEEVDAEGGGQRVLERSGASCSSLRKGSSNVLKFNGGDQRNVLDGDDDGDCLTEESESDSERDKEAEEEVRRFSVYEMYEQVLKVTKSAKSLKHIRRLSLV
jgi:hypothetical protein